jgi:hypothetical protein
MDLNLLTIANRANLGNRILKSFDNATSRIIKTDNITRKINDSTEFDSTEKLQNREFAIIGLTTIVEQFLNEVLHQVLVSHPKKFGNKKFEIDELMEEGSILELFYSKANQKLLDLAYGKFDKFISNFSATLELKSEIDNDLVDTINEIKLTRDCIIHSDGKANDLYFGKVGTKARASRNNEQLKVDIDYYKQSVEKINEFISDIKSKIPTKLFESKKSYIFKQMWEATCLNERFSFDEVWSIQNASMIRPKDIDDNHGFSSTEMEVYNLFRYIYSSREDFKVDFGFYFQRWKPQSNEYQVALSWLNNQFYF